MKTAAVIVTYSDRFTFLEKVIISLLKQDISEIIIVNNNSSASGSRKMHEFRAIHKDIISIVDLDKNSGSAVAFNRGVEEALKIEGIEYIWMLDDDNYTEENSFENLKKVYLEIVETEPVDSIVLTSYRTNRDFFFNAVKYKQPELCLGTNNIFRNFNILDILKKFTPFTDKKSVETEAIWGEVGSAPFGGMFFHRTLIKKMGIFDESFVLYFDDAEFSCRVREKGGKLYCALESRITDLEDSWNTNVFAPYLFSTSDAHQKIYYNIRNRVHVEKKYLVTFPPLYILNMMIYVLIVYGISAYHGNLRNIRTFTAAVIDGLAGRLGYNEKYPL